jgi:hypothetical protein
MASCGIDATVKLWSPCSTHSREPLLNRDLLYSLGYNEVERRAVGGANMFRGFNDMVRAFSRQAAEGLVAGLRKESQQQQQQQQQYCCY